MKFVKKLTALFLAVVMTMAMGITAFAADQITLTIDKAESGHTYKVYQILTGDLTELSTETVDKDHDNASQGRLSNMKPGSSVKDDYVAAGTTQANYKAATDKILAALSEQEGGQAKKDTDGNFVLLSNSELGDAAYAVIDTTKPVQTVVGNDTKKAVEGLATGYYIITDEYTEGGTSKTTLSRNVVTLVGSTTIKPKNETPTLDKKITNTDDATKPIDGDTAKTNKVAIGDTINYEITGQVPNTTGYKYYYYVVNDTLSKGLTLDQTSIKVYIGDSETPLDASNYTIVVSDVKDDDDNVIGTNFKLGFKDIKSLVDTDDNGVNIGDAIIIKYNAVLDEDAVVGTAANTNDVNLIYSNDPKKSEEPVEPDEPGIPPENPDEDHPYGETTKVTTKTYTTEIKLTKVQKDQTTILTGAQFTLTGENLNTIKFTSGEAFEKITEADYVGTVYYLLKDGTYTTTQKTAENADDYADTTDTFKKVTVLKADGVGTANASISAFVQPDGTVTFTGLNAGKYTLTETVTPSGYNTIDPIKFEIKAAAVAPATAGEASGIDWSITMDPTNKDTSFSFTEDKTNGVDDGTFSAKVVNIPGTLLPSTGGMGTTLIYAAGIAMIIAAGVVVIIRKRMA